MSVETADQSVGAPTAAEARNSAEPGRLAAIRRSGWAVVAVGALSAALAAFGVYTTRVWPFTVDDGFITFRYSSNLAAGHGPTFNPGLDHAEGYTSVLWMLVMAIPHAVGISPVLFAKATGLMLTLAAMGVTYLVVDRHSQMLDRRVRPLVSIAPAILLLLFVPTAVHAVAGMETPLYTFSLTAFLGGLALYEHLPRRWAPHLIALGGLLVGLSRPEGNIAVVVGIVCLLVLGNRRRRTSLLSTSLVLYVIPGLIYLVWRYSYYGHLFPLPYYLKLGDQPLLAGFSEFKKLVHLLVWLLPLAALGVTSRAWRRLLPATLAAASFVVFFWFPAPITAYEWRFLYPVLPFGAVLVALGAARFLSWWPAGLRRWRTARWVAASGLVVLVGLGVRNVTRDTPAQLRLYNWDGVGANRVREDFGRYLARFDSRPASHVLAMRDSGATPYYSGWRSIDIFGLNDSRLATNRDLGAAYILSYHPEVIVITNRGNGAVSTQFAKDLKLYNAARSLGMRRVLSMKVTDRYYYWVLAKPDTRIASYLEAWTPVVPGTQPRGAGNSPVLGA